MKKQIKITVLLPVYNAEKYLKEALDSILNQTFRDFELLIINDGSKDNSENIIKSYSDKRIRLINNSKNLGLIKTLNKGIDLAGGKYIARMDADDIMMPDRLNVQYDFLEKNPEVVVAGSYIKKFGGKFKVTRRCQCKNDIKYWLYIGCPIAHPSVLIRSCELKQHKYNLNYAHAEDYKLWYDLSKVGKIVVIPKMLLKYRISNEQVSSKYNKEQKLTSAIIRREFVNDFFAEIGFNEEIPDTIDDEYIRRFKIGCKKYLHSIEELSIRKDAEQKYLNILYCLYFSRKNFGLFVTLRFVFSSDFFNKFFFLKKSLRIVYQSFVENNENLFKIV